MPLPTEAREGCPRGLVGDACLCTPGASSMVASTADVPTTTLPVTVASTVTPIENVCAGAKQKVSAERCEPAAWGAWTPAPVPGVIPALSDMC